MENGFRQARADRTIPTGAKVRYVMVPAYRAIQCFGTLTSPSAEELVKEMNVVPTSPKKERQDGVYNRPLTSDMRPELRIKVSMNRF